MMSKMKFKKKKNKLRPCDLNQVSPSRNMYLYMYVNKRSYEQRYARHGLKKCNFQNQTQIINGLERVFFPPNEKLWVRTWLYELYNMRLLSYCQVHKSMVHQIFLELDIYIYIYIYIHTHRHPTADDSQYFIQI